MGSRLIIATCLLGGIVVVGACAWDKFEVPSPAEGGAGSSAGGTGGDAGGAAGGTGGEGGSPASFDGCGRIDLLSDSFDDLMRSYLWSTRISSGGAAHEDNGFLLTNPGGSSGVGLYRSTRRYDLTGGSVTVRVLQVPDAAVSGSESAVLRVEEDDGRFASIRLNSDRVEAGFRVNGGYNSLATETPYSATTHAYVRISEVDGELLWQHSGNGSTFTDFASSPVTTVFADVTRMRVAVGAALGVSDVVSESHFSATVGASNDSIQAWCPMPALRDTFDDTFRSSEWRNSHGSANISATEVDGQLVMTLAPGLSGDRQYVSSQAYDLTGSDFIVEVPEISGVPSTTFVELQGDDALIAINLVAATDMDTNADVFTVNVTVDPSDGDPIPVVVDEPYDPAAYRWLRIEEAAGELIFHSSTDGITWTSFGKRSPNTIPVTDLRAAIGVRSSGASPSPGRSVFDNVNSPPQ